MFPLPRELRQLQEEIMFDKHSDFALNKLDKDAIVCPSATGIHTRLTRENFSSEEEFLYWKALSDADYHDTEQTGRSFYDNCVMLIDALDSAGSSIEDILIAPLLAAEENGQRLYRIQQIREALTEKQYRRLLLYYLKGMTEAEIAELEGVGQQRISKSLISGMAVLKKFLKNF